MHLQLHVGVCNSGICDRNDLRRTNPVLLRQMLGEEPPKVQNGIQLQTRGQRDRGQELKFLSDNQIEKFRTAKLRQKERRLNLSFFLLSFLFSLPLI